MKCRVSILLTLGLIAIGMPRAGLAEEAKTELEGTWTLLSASRNGRPLRAPTDSKLVVTGNKLVVKTGDTVSVAGTIKLDTTKKPKAIDTTYTEGPNKDETIKGVYEISGDTLRLCEAGSADNERPTDVKSKAGTGEQSSVYKRAK